MRRRRLRVRRLRLELVSAKAADLWGSTVARGFAEREEDVEPGLEIAAPTIQNPRVRCFLARVDGQPAGGGALIVRDGLATLFSASTLPAFRHQGVHTALLHARLQCAVQESTLATVTTTPGADSQRNVERAGFRVAYTRLRLIRDVGREGSARRR